MKRSTTVCLLSSFALAVSLVGCATHAAAPQVSTETPAVTLAPLPETVTSFGAVTADGWLYAV
ncbi:MAG: hypothetical protein K9N62_06715 [Verrucomicrobia bacterium]|jgi:hypothetical protein|nr:hypothetical protein [Verrucomicrobiota bacterium]